MNIGTEAQNYSKVSCGAPVRSRPEAPIVAYALFAATCVAVFVRVISRSPWMIGKWDFWWDDWITLSCLVRIVYHLDSEKKNINSFADYLDQHGGIFMVL